MALQDEYKRGQDFLPGGWDFGEQGGLGGRGTKSHGRGAYGLPEAFSGWRAPARYAFTTASDFMDKAQPLADYYKGEMGKDYSGSLQEMSRTSIERGASESQRMGQQASTRAGLGGSVSSPWDSFQTQIRMMASSGQMGIAAQQAEIQARGMKDRAALNLYNVYSGMYQAQMAPAQIQAAGGGNVPVGGAGPSYLQGGAQFIQGAAGAGG